MHVSSQKLFYQLCSFCRSLYLNYLGLLATVSLAMFCGLTMYSIYMKCDPLTNNDVGSPDQVRGTQNRAHIHYPIRYYIYEIVV
jgi:hypothetical protein